jgi:tyrosine-protein phosphatase YwqE
MENENQRERLVELLNEATFGVNVHTLADHLSRETIDRVAEYLMANNVVVLPENAMLNVNSRMVIEEETMRIVEKETYTISWEKEKYCMAEEFLEDNAK